MNQRVDADNEPTSCIKIEFVTCVSDTNVLNERLLSSPCFQERKAPLNAFFNSTSAALAFNSAADALCSVSSDVWLVWVHEDVVLPADWERQFELKLLAAVEIFPKLAVAGVYGHTGQGTEAKLIGAVLDRGTLRIESSQLPCSVDSIDEMLFAVRLDSGLRLDPALKFDFYATDLVLQAREQGWQAAVVDAYCEHWSGTPQFGMPPEALARRIKQSAEVFETKWAHRMPITTTCFSISKPGDVAAYIDSLAAQEAL